jgi:hypothetical protein
MRQDHTWRAAPAPWRITLSRSQPGGETASWIEEEKQYGHAAQGLFARAPRLSI